MECADFLCVDDAGDVCRFDGKPCDGAGSVYDFTNYFCRHLPLHRLTVDSCGVCALRDDCGNRLDDQSTCCSGS